MGIMAWQRGCLRGKGVTSLMLPGWISRLAPWSRPIADSPRGARRGCTRRGLTVPAGAARRGQRDPVLVLARCGGLARRALVRGGPGAGQILAADPDGGGRDDQG